MSTTRALLTGARLASVVAATLVLVSCGGEEEADGGPRQRVDGDAVIRHFQEALDLELRRTNAFEGVPGVMASRWESIEPSAEAERALGTFTMGVFRDLDVAREEGFIPERDGAEPNGVLWEFKPRDELSPARWGATKVYENVVVTWYAPARALDERWRLLDQTLEELVGPG